MAGDGNGDAGDVVVHPSFHGSMERMRKMTWSSWIHWMGDGGSVAAANGVGGDDLHSVVLGGEG